jgi:tRNA A-37 threonylcarbamoyl transferase component Bud32
LHLLALEPVGEAITGPITRSLRKKMKEALGRLHSAGYVHGDVSSSNFCERNDKVFIVDLESCRRSADFSEMKHEMELIDSIE